MSAESHRTAIRAFMKARGLKTAPWTRDAGVRESTLRDFLSGRNASMTTVTLEKLASVEGTTIAELIGEKPRERPSRDMVAVKGIKVEAAMGGGCDVSDESEGEPFFFRRSWIEKILGTQDSLLRVISLDGDSMEPTLSDGDVALIHVHGSDPATRPGIYCIWDGHGLKVKRLELLPGKRGKLRVLSDNAAISPPYEVNVEDIRIIGRVIWRGGLV